MNGVQHAFKLFSDGLFFAVNQVIKRFPRQKSGRGRQPAHFVLRALRRAHLRGQALYGRFFGRGHTAHALQAGNQLFKFRLRPGPFFGGFRLVFLEKFVKNTRVYFFFLGGLRHFGGIVGAGRFARYHQHFAEGVFGIYVKITQYGRGNQYSPQHPQQNGDLFDYVHSYAASPVSAAKTAR